MTLYLDASVLVTLIQDEIGTDAVHKLLASHPEARTVSDLARGEVASAVSRQVRMRTIDAEEGLDRLSMFERWVMLSAEQIPTDAPDVRLGVRLVQRFDLALRLPDAIHIAAAQLRKSTLVTLDKQMSAAAHALGLSVLYPGSDVAHT